MSLHSLTPPSTRRTTPAQAHAIWRRYRATGDTRMRDRLVMAYLPMVQYIVSKKVRDLPARCEAQDFVSCGIVGLIGAIERFDDTKGATLEQYAWTRVQGAVIDELRRMDWAPRSLRRWERDASRARDRFLAQHGRAPSRDEVAELLGVDAAEVERREGELSLVEVVSLNEVVSAPESSSIERLETIPDPDGWLDPEDAAARQSGKEAFRGAFRELSTREREVAVMLYLNNMTLREIGDELGVSESRVCQLHAQIKTRLRHSLAGQEELIRAVC